MAAAHRERIEDTGRKLGGARKDARTRKSLASFSPRHHELPPLLADLWPKPDFRQDVLNGVASSRQAALFMVVYRTLPSRPFGDETIELLNDGSVDDYTAAVRFLQSAYEGGLIEDYAALREAFTEADEKWSLSVGRPRAFYAAGRKAGQRSLRHALDIKLAGQVLAEFLPEWGWPYEERIRDDDAFGVWRLTDSHGGPGKWVCIHAHGRKAEILSDGRYETRAEAIEAARPLIEAALDKRDGPQAGNGSAGHHGRPTLTGDARRIGPSRRRGSVSAQEFAGTFRFRGVEFGNWLSQAERQAALDLSFDALLDLTDLCELPPAFASLGGKLGVGFASRGRGFRSGAAHFEPTKWILHFTKRSGAGALAHEFGHAFDYYVGELLEPGTTLSKLMSRMDDDTHGFGEPGLREAILEPARRLYQTTCGGLQPSQWTRFQVNADALDRGRKKRYWSSRDEMFARSFEAWTMDALAARGHVNEYLVYGAGGDAAIRWKLPFEPFPQGEERRLIVRAMGDLVRAAATYWKEKRRGG